MRPAGAGSSAVVVNLLRCGPMLSPRVPHHLPPIGCADSPRCAFSASLLSVDHSANRSIHSAVIAKDGTCISGSRSHRVISACTAAAVTARPGSTWLPHQRRQSRQRQATRRGLGWVRNTTNAMSDRTDIKETRPEGSFIDAAAIAASTAACCRSRTPCGCRKLCRGWSGGISVLVDESATAGRSNDLEVPIWLVCRVGGDGWSLVERTVGPVRELLCQARGRIRVLEVVLEVCPDAV